MENLDYGIIGNCSTAALISKEAAIEWLCLPHFDSPSMFASILDPKIGGIFELTPQNPVSIDQKYIPNTNILITKFVTETAVFDLIDFMPRYTYDEGGYHCPPDLIRFIRIRSGSPVIRFKYNPAMNYGASKTITRIHDSYAKSFSTNGIYESLYLYSNLDLKKVLATEPVTLTEDSYFLLSYNEKLPNINLDFINLEYQLTRAYWMKWSARSTYPQTPYNKEVIRSLLVLKLLTFQPTGAILAAATTSLPESIGSQRNWDYRFCWIRDASMTISVLARMGHMNAARRFMQFILSIIPFKDEKIQIMYGIRGEKNLTEYILNHLSGYQSCVPVRIGNAAYNQKQNDIYGVLLDVINIFLRTFPCDSQTKESLWTVVRSLAKVVTSSWSEPDRGIWEYRSQIHHFTFSKLLCWMAMDRASSIASLMGKHNYTQLWNNTREQIRKEILEKGWSEQMQSFSQFYGSNYVDAANLLMEPYGFLSADDPRYISTVKKTEERLCKNGFMYRYRNDDDFGKPESSFTLCSFWMIAALFKIGEKEKARAMFDNLLSRSNHLGLFSEDIDFTTGRLLGNFPQAYSHLALIDTAILLYAKEPVTIPKTSDVMTFNNEQVTISS